MSKEIQSVDEQLAAEVDAIKGSISSPASRAIKTKDKMFTLPEGLVVPAPMDVVIIDFITQNKYYDQPWDPNNIQPPACFAIGKDIDDMKPSDNSPDKQANSCEECPQNQFGSAGRGKACKNTRVLAVLPLVGDEPQQLATLTVSPTAIKAFDAYVGLCSKMFKAPPIKLITEVRFNPDKTWVSLVFDNPRPNPDYKEHFALRTEAEFLLTAEPDVSGAVAAGNSGSRRGRRKGA